MEAPVASEDCFSLARHVFGVDHDHNLDMFIDGSKLKTVAQSTVCSKTASEKDIQDTCGITQRQRPVDPISQDRAVNRATDRLHCRLVDRELLVAQNHTLHQISASDIGVSSHQCPVT